MKGLHNGGTIRTSRNKELILEYAQWVMSECDNPIDEIEWLIYYGSDDVYEGILDWELAYKNK
jgi:hypothetical protein